jgi:plasmid stabilization system protein ParE
MSKVKIRWSNQALENLTDIVQYWEGKSPRRARAVGRAILDKINLLADFPDLGKPIEGLPPVYRETFADDYRILYKHIEDTHVLLITVRHGKQSPLSPDEIVEAEKPE